MAAEYYARHGGTAVRVTSERLAWIGLTLSSSILYSIVIGLDYKSIT